MRQTPHSELLFLLIEKRLRSQELGTMPSQEIYRNSSGKLQGEPEERWPIHPEAPAHIPHGSQERENWECKLSRPREPRLGVGNRPGRDQKKKSPFLKSFIVNSIANLSLCTFQAPSWSSCSKERSETTLIAPLMQNSTNGHWWTVKTLQIPVASYLHGHLCYPGHVLPVLKGTVVSLQLTTARAPGCGGWTLPRFSLGQQEDLTLLMACLHFFYSPHLLTELLSAKKENRFLLIFTEIENDVQCTKCCQRGHFCCA